MTIKLSNNPSSNEIRKAFLDFYVSKGHTAVASASLVPHEDPTLLFTNAGMNQFKDVFLGFDKRTYTRATSSQKCVRAGGKHNDLENVGYTARHHTFFEMLGNFSFGDYFKQDAIKFAWELLTEVYQLPVDKLLVTVYKDDDEAYDVWAKDIGLPADKIIRIGDNRGAPYASDNFWMMGDTGPCGPCSEIFYDHGAHIPGGQPGSPDEDGDRFIEIWNNVFMQYDRDETGTMSLLPKPSVDTGMGLERISAILQGVHTNYEIDLFTNLIAAAARETKTKDLKNPSLNVLADHIRACSFLIADGVIPGNEGRGYVLRRIIRRAVRHGYKLGVRKAFFNQMLQDLVDEMGEAYPELVTEQKRIHASLKQEEERFFETIENGMTILETELKNTKDQFNGETAFKLHDTYGFPLDLTADICRERDVTVDTTGFDTAMARQKDQARAAGKFKIATNLEYDGVATTFYGYEQLETSGEITALYLDGTAVDQLSAGEKGVVILDNTPFYAESGGQVGDIGQLRSSNSLFDVEGTQKVQATVFGHHGTLTTGTLSVGESITAQVDLQARSATMRNHSATHLMHKALREVLGDHVQQKGSLVDADKTRFDFLHNAPMTNEEIRQVESIVNAEIFANLETQSRVIDIDAAKETGALMLFGEKYGDEVRVLNIGSSCELCGGTHVKRTGDIGLFTIVAEGGIAASVRRVEAVTATNALSYMQDMETTLGGVAGTLKVLPAEVPTRIIGLLNQVKKLEHELSTAKGKLASSQGDDLATQAIDISGIKVLTATLEGADANSLRETMDKLKDKLTSAAIVLAAVNGEKVSIAAGVTKDVIPKFKAGDLVNHVAKQVGGKGGGKPGMAMAGGTDASQLPQALASVQAWVKEKI
jgi:alanyl-tRNA synthetase